MSDEADRLANQTASANREANLVSTRIAELYESPLRGRFDAAHLKAVHAYLFQDLPHHRPGVIRDDAPDGWIKQRSLEGQSGRYQVHYAHLGVEKRIEAILHGVGDVSTLKLLPTQDAVRRMAKLYGDLDHAHGFYEGNSRTLREFTRLLAADTGYTLDWVKTGVTARERNKLYVARDVAVLERAFPDLTPERALTTADRAEYEASFVLSGLRRTMGTQSLEGIIGVSMTRQRAAESLKAPSIKRQASRPRAARDITRDDHER